METATQNSAENAKQRNYTPLTPEQKRASSLRRDAAMLDRLAAGSSNPAEMKAQASALRAEADKLAPASTQNAKAQPLTGQEWTAIENAAIQDIRGFLSGHISTNKLRKIATGDQS